MAKRTSRKQTKSKGSKGSKRVKTTKGRKKAVPRAARTTRTKRAKAAKRTRPKRTSRTPATRRPARTRRTPSTPAEPSRLASATAAVKGAMAGAVAAVSRRMPGSRTDTDAITLLETDHRRLEDLLKRGEETTERAATTRTELLKTITAELAVHELIEEQLLYPALKKYPEARDIVLEGFQEHHVADVILKELHAVATSSEQWGAKFKVLKENIEHHIEEEEGPMFRTARGVMSREELQALGAQMAKMKRGAESRR